jgi:predicted nucleic acid-binding protein
MKASVYIETTIISYLTGRPSRDVVIAAHQELTRQWWEVMADKFKLVISELVEQEVGRGDPSAAQARTAMIGGLDILIAGEEAVALAEQIILSGAVPRESAADALHIATAAIHGIDYLLTWNCAHLANARLRGKIEKLINRMGYACPIICTPEELMED